MEKGLVQATRILVICTDMYVEKANASKGGTGFEKGILTAQLMSDLTSRHIIPVVRQSSKENEMPDFLANRVYIDFCNDHDIQ